MKSYNIAGLKVNIKTYYDRVKSQAAKYEIPFTNTADIVVNLPEKYYQEQKDTDMSHLSIDDIEYLISGACFYYKLIDFQGFMLHSSSIEYKGYAYLFSANSGVGKSTHVSQWQKLFKDDVHVINDDKPAVRLINDTFYACGTPFSGKCDLSNNILVPIKAIIFIKRGENNSIRKLDSKEAFVNIYQQTIKNIKKEKMEDLLSILDKFLKIVPFYELSCTISTEAAQLVYDTLNQR